MEIERYCKNCHKHFDGHWTNYPEGIKPKCFYCKSENNVISSTDEILDDYFREEELNNED